MSRHNRKYYGHELVERKFKLNIFKGNELKSKSIFTQKVRQ
jgi:hypothetical protein